MTKTYLPLLLVLPLVFSSGAYALGDDPSPDGNFILDSSRFTILAPPQSSPTLTSGGFGVHLMNTTLEAPMSEEDRAHQKLMDLYNDPKAIIKPSQGMIDLSIKMKVERDFKYGTMTNFYKAHGITNVDSSCELALEIAPTEWKEHMEVFNQQKCFTNRLKLTTSLEDEYHAIELSKQSCDCVKEHPLNQAAWAELERAAPPADAAMLSDLKTNIEDKAQVLNDDFTAMMLQASSLAQNKTEAEAMATRYTQVVQDTQETISSAKDIVRRQATEKLARLNTGKNYSVEVEPILSLIKPPELPSVMMAKMEKEAGDCFTMQMYLQKKQNEKDEGFEIALEETNGKMEPDAWNYSKLTKAYDDKVREASKASGQARMDLILDSNRIKSKMTFLIRNPLIKNVFMAKESDMGAEDISADDILQKQRKLFRIMFENFTDRKMRCPLANFKCVMDRSKDYNTRLGEFFKDSDVTYMAKMTAKAELDRNMESEDDLEKLFTPAVRTTNTGLEQAFFKKYKMSTRDCAGDNVKNIEYCVKAFTKYCPMVDLAAQALANNSDASGPSLEVEMAERNKMSLDPTKNLEYQEERKRICEDTRLDANGNKSTYAMFKKNECAGVEDSQCLANFSRRYVRHFNSTKDQAESDLQSSIAISCAATTAPATTISSRSARYMSDNAVSAKNSRKYDSSYYEEKVAASYEKSQGKSTAEKASPTATAAKGEVAQEATTAPVSAAATIPNIAPTSAISPAEAKKLYKETAAQQQRTKSELADSRSDKEVLAASDKADSPEAKALEAKIANLEALLASQTKQMEKLKSTMDSPSSDSGKAETADSKSPKASPDGSENPAKPTTFAAAASTGTSDPGRAPASMASSSTTSQSSSSAPGAGSLGGSSGIGSNAIAPDQKAGGMNQTLLTLNEMKRNASGTVIVTQETDLEGLRILTTDADTKVVPMTVTSKQYKKFKENDLKTLEDFYADKLEGLTSNELIINITTPDKKESLQFYASKQNGRVTFRPVRLKKLETINDILRTLTPN